jgi:protein-tyrosine-phosphatase
MSPHRAAATGIRVAAPIVGHPARGGKLPVPTDSSQGVRGAIWRRGAQGRVAVPRAPRVTARLRVAPRLHLRRPMHGSDGPPSVLFVDESNTRLGFMAEHVARRRLGGGALVTSAGFDVREAAPSERAVACLASQGIAVDAHAPRPLRAVDVASFDVVIALSRAAADKLPRSARRRIVTWSVPDPWQGSDETYHHACMALCNALEELLLERERATAAE